MMRPYRFKGPGKHRQWVEDGTKAGSYVDLKVGDVIERDPPDPDPLADRFELIDPNATAPGVDGESLAARTRDLDEREALLRRAADGLAERDEVLAKRESALAEREKTLADGEAALASLTETLETREKSVAEREAKLPAQTTEASAAAGGSGAGEGSKAGGKAGR